MTAHQIHTALYVDGENFTIRCQEYARITEPKEDAHCLKKGVFAIPSIPAQARSGLTFWTHQPSRVPWLQREARIQSLREQLFVPDCVYWDFFGLDLAVACSFGQGLAAMPERCVYFATAPGNMMRQVEELLHNHGFNPRVFRRVKPDGFAKKMAEENMTVITRPKGLDIALATQILEDAEADNFHRCILFAGDEDYVPLVEAIKRRGKIVWVVFPEKYMAKSQGQLRLTCDRFIPYDPVLEIRCVKGRKDATTTMEEMRAHAKRGAEDSPEDTT